jgi:hypothetical protein
MPTIKTTRTGTTNPKLEPVKPRQVSTRGAPLPYQVTETGKLLNKVGELHIPTTDVKLSNGMLLSCQSIKTDIPDSGKYQILEYGVWDASDKLRVIASLDRTHHGPLLHVSCSYPKRDPSWGVIKAVRYAFYPADIDVMMVLPRVSDYINLMTHCFQMTQIPTIWGVQ